MAPRSLVDVLWSDEELLAVNKRAGQLVNPDRAGGETLAQVIAQLSGGDRTLRLVHRLDRDTSGVLLLARSADAQRALAAQFAAHSVEKRYLALVRGAPPAEAGEIALPLAPDPRRRRVVVDERHGAPALTSWVLVERFGSAAALLRCTPATGRQHQLRVHLAARGMPLLVDPKYGDAAELWLSAIKPRYRSSGRHPERPLLARASLHAESLAFDHPRSGERLRVLAPLPRDLEATLRQLRRTLGSRALAAPTV
jgi:RluA family pseudouridine synthase